jgi:hypothetical protein
MLTKDIGVDSCDYRPWGFEELRDYMSPRIDKNKGLRAAALRGENTPLA